MPATAATFDELPIATQRLLHLRVPVTVTLASKKQSVGQILELGPGAIIQFEKSCEEPLELSVGERCIGHGVAVKVGDKFGLRLSTLNQPASEVSP